MKAKNKQGAALIFVMVAMIILFTMVSVAINVSQANTHQAGMQEKKLRAYYVARSGAELAYEVMMTTEPSLLDDISEQAIPSDTVKLVLQETDVDFGYGSADINVSAFDPNNDPDLRKILIESIGSLPDGTTRKVVLEFSINYGENPNITWSK